MERLDRKRHATSTAGRLERMLEQHGSKGSSGGGGTRVYEPGRQRHREPWRHSAVTGRIGLLRRVPGDVSAGNVPVGCRILPPETAATEAETT